MHYRVALQVGSIAYNLPGKHDSELQARLMGAGIALAHLLNFGGQREYSQETTAQLWISSVGNTGVVHADIYEIGGPYGQIFLNLCISCPEVKTKDLKGVVELLRKKPSRENYKKVTGILGKGRRCEINNFGLHIEGLMNFNSRDMRPEGSMFAFDIPKAVGAVRQPDFRSW